MSDEIKKKTATNAIESNTLLELRVRQLITQKEFATAQANRDTAIAGWRMDYIQWQNQLDSEIDQLIENYNVMLSRAGSKETQNGN